MSRKMQNLLDEKKELEDKIDFCEQGIEERQEYLEDCEDEHKQMVIENEIFDHENLKNECLERISDIQQEIDTLEEEEEKSE